MLTAFSFNSYTKICVNIMKYFIFGLTLIFLTACTSAARADLILTLSSGTSSVVVIDESLAGTLSSAGSFTSTSADSLAGAGIIGYSGAVGGFIVNVTTGISKPLIGPYAIDLNSVSVSGTAGTLTIGLIDTDFVVPGNGLYTLLSELGGATDGIVGSATGGALDSNAEIGFSADTLQGPFGAGPFSGADRADVFLNGSFSLNTVVTITHSGAGQITSFNHKLSVVPEPGSCAVLFVVTCLFGLRRWRA